MGMHADEFPVDESLVRELLAEQFPQWSQLPLRRLITSGTDNAIYKLGAEKTVRIPIIAAAAGQPEHEARWLALLAPSLPLAVPAVIASGQPTHSYPWHWSIHRWIEGQDAARPPTSVDLVAVARQLGEFSLALQRIELADAPKASRHHPIEARDTETRAAIAELGDLIDADAATRAWEAALKVPADAERVTWIHGDFHPANLLLRDDRLVAVIDWAGAGLGDPAWDLLPAWSLFHGASRTAFRATLGVDEATWVRGRGLALSQAAIFVPYYWETNPSGVEIARRALDTIAADIAAGGVRSSGS